MMVLLFLILLSPLLISSTTAYIPVDCNDIYLKFNQTKSKVYTIYPSEIPVSVFCDMATEKGRWTVIQRRSDGSMNFYRPWDEYKLGFGVDRRGAGEYWLGLENLYYLTRNRKTELRVDMEDFEGNKAYARYTSFQVSPECEGYKLRVSGFINRGGAGDSLSHHNGHKFSTFDKDQDASSHNCAKLYLGAFWYDNCHATNPNGVYSWGANGTKYGIGVNWKTWKGYNYSLKNIRMKIRPKN